MRKGREGGQEHGATSEALVSSAPLDEVLVFFNTLTERRNARQLPFLWQRLQHLNEGVGQLTDAVRMRKIETLPGLAAKAGLRIFTTLQALGNGEEEKQRFRDLFISELSRKYPEVGCKWCGKKPCFCGVRRSKNTHPIEPTQAQKKWTLADWQRNLGEVYGPANAQRGMEFVASRLNAEVREADREHLLMNQAMSVDDPVYAERMRNMVTELADSFAWVVGTLNVLAQEKTGSRIVRLAGSAIGLNVRPQLDLSRAPQLQEIWQNVYGHGCPNGEGFVCNCKEFGYEEDAKKTSNHN